MIARLLALLFLLLAAGAGAGRNPGRPCRPADRRPVAAGERPLRPSPSSTAASRASTSGLEPAPAGARLIDLSSRTVLPGLIDAHVHLSGNPSGEFWREAVDPDEWGMILGVENARTTARAGFTTVRDVGSAPQVGHMLRRGTAEGSDRRSAHPLLGPGFVDHRRPWRRQRLPARGDRGAVGRQYLHRRRGMRGARPRGVPRPAPTSDQVHRHRRRAVAAGPRPRGAFHRRGDAGDRRPPPMRSASGSPPTPMAPAASRRRPAPGSIRSSTAPSPTPPRSRRCAGRTPIWCRP